MKYILIVMLFLSAALALFAGSSENDSSEWIIKGCEECEPVDANAAIRERIDLRIEKIKKELKGKLDKSDQRRVHELLDEIQELILLLPAKPVHRIEPISKGDLSDLKDALRRAAFADDQLEVLRSASQGNYYKCSQIIEILEIFPFSSDKLEALKATYPKCLDTGNNFKIVDAFVFDKDQAREIIDSTVFR